MNPKIRLTWLRTLKEPIIWPLVVFYLARYYGISAKILFLISLIAIPLFIYKNNAIILPRISGMNLYVIFIIYSAAIGLMIYSPRYVIRDIYYVLPTIVIVCIGYWCERSYTKKSIFATIALSGSLIAFFNIIYFIEHIGEMNNMDSIRGCFGKEVYEVGVSFAIILIVVILFERELISHKFDKFMFGLVSIQMALSLGRAAIVQAGITVILGCILYIAFSTNWQEAIKKSTKIFTMLIVMVVFVICIIPNGVTEDFFEKWDKSTEEINSQQEFDSTGEAIENWRAYEIQSAKKEWKQSNILIMIFGYGMGKGVQLKYIPFAWRQIGMVVDNQIPLLHNAYYTILPKGGVFGVFSLLCFLVGTMIYALRFIKIKEKKCKISVLITVSVSMMVIAYFVRGIVAQESSIGWALVIGSMNYVLRYGTVEKKED